MPAKLSTTISKIKTIPHKENAAIIASFYEFMKSHDAFERHQDNNLKAVVSYSNFLDNRSLKEVSSKEDILSYIQTKVKCKDDDPDQRWITTYNDYLHRIKHFFRWLHNLYEKEDAVPMDFWENPDFIKTLKPKKTKRVTPYSETELWEKVELLSIVKYENIQKSAYL